MLIHLPSPGMILRLCREWSVSTAANHHRFVAGLLLAWMLARSIVRTDHLREPAATPLRPAEVPGRRHAGENSSFEVSSSFPHFSAAYLHPSAALSSVASMSSPRLIYDEDLPVQCVPTCSSATDFMSPLPGANGAEHEPRWRKTWEGERPERQSEPDKSPPPIYEYDSLPRVAVPASPPTSALRAAGHRNHASATACPGPSSSR